jgi:hypothetical protein
VQLILVGLDLQWSIAMTTASAIGAPAADDDQPVQADPAHVSITFVLMMQHGLAELVKS